MGCRDGNAQDHFLSIDHKDMAGRVERCTDGENPKATPKEGVCWVSDLDEGHFFRFWVVEGGIKLCSRLTISLTGNC
jgi:hypothetical protein